ncbi:DNA-binding protein [Acinetobacter baumannii]
MMRTSQEVRSELQKRGLSIADWARQNGFTPELVHQVLNSNKIPVRGKSHQIAVKLGLKDGIIEPDFTFEKNEGDAVTRI